MRNRTVKTPKLDMNPMVDMAFLLVTFFLLATTFKMPEQAAIQLPYSSVETPLPEQKLLTISIDIDGIVFLALSNRDVRAKWLRNMAAMYNIELNENEVEAFAQLPGFGMPINTLIPFLELDRGEQLDFQSPGIPVDSLQNELSDWLVVARAIQPGLKIAIKADQRTRYQHIDKVIKTLTKNGILRFNLVTDKRVADGIEK